MKILLYGINYAPELTGIGKYSGEMAAWLARQGHPVSVVTAPPYYPQWAVGQGYSASRYQHQFIDGVSVTRCPLWVPARPGGLKRLVHLASFALSSLPVMIWQALRHRPDVIMVVEPSQMCAPAAWLAARLSGAKAWLHIQDYEVDAAFDLGLITSPLLRRFALWAERKLMGGFDRVSTISGKMLERAESKGVSAGQLFFLPNWVNLDQIVPLDHRPAFRRELGITDDAVVALYSGNMGCKQGLEILSEVARLVPQVQFVFCGNGPMRAVLEQGCAGLPNAIFLDLQPLEKLGDLLNMADIHLLPQRADAADLVMPSKLTGMLSSGRAVIATAQPGTELASVVATCGMVVPPEDAAALADAVSHLANGKPLRVEMGQRARLYAERHLDIHAILSNFARECQHLIEQPVGGSEHAE